MTIEQAESTYSISSYSFLGNYSFLKVVVRQLFKGGNYSREETIDFLFSTSTQNNWFLLSMTTATKKYCITFWDFGVKCPSLLTYLPISLNNNIRKLYSWGNYSKEETIQGRKLLIIRRVWPRKLFKGGNYSREETIWGNTVLVLLT